MEGNLKKKILKGIEYIKKKKKWYYWIFFWDIKNNNIYYNNKIIINNYKKGSHCTKEDEFLKPNGFRCRNKKVIIFIWYFKKYLKEFGGYQN